MLLVLVLLLLLLLLLLLTRYYSSSVGPFSLHAFATVHRLHHVTPGDGSKQLYLR